VNPAAKNPSGPPGPAALTPARTGKSALPRPDRKPGTRRPTPPTFTIHSVGTLQGARSPYSQRNRPHFVARIYQIA